MADNVVKQGSVRSHPRVPRSATQARLQPDAPCERSMFVCWLAYGLMAFMLVFCLPIKAKYQLKLA
jgi:hypothetical protein